MSCRQVSTCNSQPGSNVLIGIWLTLAVHLLLMGAQLSDRVQQTAARWSALDDRLTKLEERVAQRRADASLASHGAGTAGSGLAGDALPMQADPGLDAQILGAREDASAGPLQVEHITDRLCSWRIACTPEAMLAVCYPSWWTCLCRRG